MHTCFSCTSRINTFQKITVLSFHITFARKNVNILKQSCLIYGISFYQKLLDTMGFYPSSCGSTAHNNFHFTAEDLQRERKKVSPDNAGRYDANLPTTHSFFSFFFFWRKHLHERGSQRVLRMENVAEKYCISKLPLRWDRASWSFLTALYCC